ncbi:MAG: nucleotidyltransferase domain-containing protein [Cyanobacteria bacterium J06627_28]
MILSYRLESTEYGADYHLKKLGFFGSYARNQATADSDVDIVFATDRPNLFKTAMLKQDLEALLDRPVDVVRLHQYLTPGFRDRIDQEAIYV